MSGGETTVSLTINGSPRNLAVEPQNTLLDALRDILDLTGTKRGCDEAVCGACTVLVDGRGVCSCTMLAVEADGHVITTIEGLERDGRLDPLQNAFVEHDALQCGFCTSGQILAAKSYLDGPRSAVPSEDEVKEALSGNLCRCGAYNKIVDAVIAIALERRGSE